MAQPIRPPMVIATTADGDVRLPYVVLVDAEGNRLEPMPETMQPGDLLRWDGAKFVRLPASTDVEGVVQVSAGGLVSLAPSAHVGAPSGGLTIDMQARAAIDAMRQILIDKGLMDPPP